MRSRTQVLTRIEHFDCAAPKADSLRNQAEMTQNVATLDDCRICRLG